MTRPCDNTDMDDPHDLPPNETPTVSDSHTPDVYGNDTATSAPVQKSEYTGARVPLDRAMLILTAHRDGHSVTAISALTGSDTRTIQAVLKRYTAPDDGRLAPTAVQSLLSAYAIEAVKDWQDASRNGAKAGKHAAARDLLLHTGHIEPLKTDTGSHGVQVFIGISGDPAGPDPLKGAKVVIGTAPATPSSDTDPANS